MTLGYDLDLFYKQTNKKQKNKQTKNKQQKYYFFYEITKNKKQ